MTKESYDNWARTYDEVKNPTRDLDHIVVNKMIHYYVNKKIVEIGCGTGKNTELLAKNAVSVHAFDFSEGMISQAKLKLHDQYNVKFSIADIKEQWPCADNVTEVVTCNLVLEHIQDLDFIFSEANRILLDSGVFIICEYHPYKQYQGKKANFLKDGNQIEITAYVHDISEFIDVAMSKQFKLKQINEWRDDDDRNTIPRLVSFVFEK